MSCHFLFCCETNYRVFQPKIIEIFRFDTVKMMEHLGKLEDVQILYSKYANCSYYKLFLVQVFGAFTLFPSQAKKSSQYCKTSTNDVWSTDISAFLKPIIDFITFVTGAVTVSVLL